MKAPDLTCPHERERRIERYVSVAAMPAGSPYPHPGVSAAGFGVPGTEAATEERTTTTAAATSRLTPVAPGAPPT